MENRKEILHPAAEVYIQSLEAQITILKSLFDSRIEMLQAEIKKSRDENALLVKSINCTNISYLLLVYSS